MNQSIPLRDDLHQTWAADPLRDHLHQAGLLHWAIEQLGLFRQVISQAIVDDQSGYSHSWEALRSTWYTYIHSKLHEHGFVNAKPQENTWEKRPKVQFFCTIYHIDPAYWRPYAGHHCSSKERQEQMLNLLDDLTTILKE